MLPVKDFRMPFLLPGVNMAGFVTLSFELPSGVSWLLSSLEAVRGRGEGLLEGVSLAGAGKGPS